MVRRLNLDTEQLQRLHHVLANLNPLIAAEIKIAGTVVRRARWLPVRTNLKQEEFKFWAHVHLVAELGGSLHLPAQHATWVSSKWFAVRQHHIADHPRGPCATLGWRPREDAPRAHVRAQQLIRLGNAGEALYGRAVEPGSVLNGARHLVDGNLDTLDGAVDVYELELDRPDPRLLGLGDRTERLTDLRFASSADHRLLRHPNLRLAEG